PAVPYTTLFRSDLLCGVHGILRGGQRVADGAKGLFGGEALQASVELRKLILGRLIGGLEVGHGARDDLGLDAGQVIGDRGNILLRLLQANLGAFEIGGRLVDTILSGHQGLIDLTHRDLPAIWPIPELIPGGSHVLVAVRPGVTRFGFAPETPDDLGHSPVRRCVQIAELHSITSWNSMVTFADVQSPFAAMSFMLYVPGSKDIQSSPRVMSAMSPTLHLPISHLESEPSTVMVSCWRGFRPAARTASACSIRRLGLSESVVDPTTSMSGFTSLSRDSSWTIRTRVPSSSPAPVQYTRFARPVASDRATTLEMGVRDDVVSRLMVQSCAMKGWMSVPWYIAHCT